MRASSRFRGRRGRVAHVATAAGRADEGGRRGSVTSDAAGLGSGAVVPRVRHRSYAVVAPASAGGGLAICCSLVKSDLHMDIAVGRIWNFARGGRWELLQIQREAVEVFRLFHDLSLHLLLCCFAIILLMSG